MANDSEPVRSTEMRPDDLISAGVAGLIGGIVFAVLVVRTTPEQLHKVGLLYGMEEGSRIGLFLHLNHSIAFGLIYARIVNYEILHDYAIRVISGVIVGLAFSLVIWLVAASVLMPTWISAVTSRSPPIPNFDLIFLAGHVAFGVILGGGYPLILARMPDTSEKRHSV